MPINRNVMAEEYTPEGLPRVSDATLEVFLRDIQRQGSEGGQTLLLSGLAQKIPRENPVFWREINQYREDSKNYSPNPKDHGLGVLAGAIIGYELLRRQAEANQIERDFNGE